MTTDTEALIEKLERAHRMSTSDAEVPVGTLWGAAAAELRYLLAELRQERERAEGHKAAFLAASAERFEAGKARDAFHDKTLAAIYAMNAAQDALSRAEETIEKAIACEEHTHRIMTDRKPTREDSSLTWRILTEYDKQKEQA